MKICRAPTDRRRDRPRDGRPAPRRARTTPIRIIGGRDRLAKKKGGALACPAAARSRILTRVPGWSRLASSIVAASILASAAGCAERPRGADSDTELRAAFNRALAHKERGRPFEIRELLPGQWTRLWFFGGYASPDLIERVVGDPWDGAPTEVSEGGIAVVVRGPGESVRGFIWDTGGRVFTDCLPADLEPVSPTDRFVLLGPVPQEDPKSHVLASAKPTARRACIRDALTPTGAPGH